MTLISKEWLNGPIRNPRKQEPTNIEKQLISFGNYLLSERRKLTVRGKAACQVNDVDLANWRAEQEKEK